MHLEKLKNSPKLIGYILVAEYSIPVLSLSP